jgi:hypothetical protein
MSGKYGRPGENQYELNNVDVAYEFDGTEEEWLEAVKLGEVE